MILAHEHITQSQVWGDFRSQTPNVKKVVRIGKYQIFFHRLPWVPFLDKYINCIAYLPRVEMPSESEIAEIKKVCRVERALFLKIEPTTVNKSTTLNSYPGKPILPRHTIYIDLSLPEEQLLAQMHEKTRYNIKLAEKKGVFIKNESSQEALDNFTKLLEATEERQGFYSHYPEYYRKLWQILRPKKMVYLLCAYTPDSPTKPVAAIMLFHYKDFLYYPYGGSNPEFRQFMAPNLLHWEAMKLGKKLKCKYYDLWGSYNKTPTEKDPWWGIYRFKSGFGGINVDYPEAIDIPLSPMYSVYLKLENLRWYFLKFLRYFK